VTARLDPATQAWMTDPRTLAVIDALTAEGGDARFVGGAVRNALLGTDVSDVDIATPIPPDEVMRRLAAAGLAAVPTGIAHGTVTAVSGGKPFEVTTLRRDVETDGRRAVIAYTTDWKEDAARRDFTINALYADLAGSVFDYFGGLDDLARRRVRFIGDPKLRIREDYLRILRLFRFHAWYGKGRLDADAYAAARACKAGLKRLSGERVHKELLRLLGAADPIATVEAMQSAGILGEILPGSLQVARLRRLVAIEKGLSRVPDPLLRLAALIADSPEAARAIAGALRFSNADRDRLVQAACPDGTIAPSLEGAHLRRHIYRMGEPAFRDQLLLRWAASGAGVEASWWRALFTAAESWRPPRFPLDGEDVMREGVAEGPGVGVILREIEQGWIEADFTLDRPALLARLKERARKP
jgi:poly(A) polymerase